MGAELKLTAYEVESSVNIGENTSQLFVKLEVITTHGTYNRSDGAAGTLGSITVNGKVYSLDDIDVARNTSTVLYNDTHTIAHNEDGTASVVVAAVFDPNTPSTDEMKISKTVALTAIPRSSTIAATDANIGAVSMVAVTRATQSYSHCILWEFGELAGWLKGDGSIAAEPVTLTESTIGFEIPDSFYEQIPNAQTGICTLTCFTFLDSTKIGEPRTTTFTVSVDANVCAPEIEFSARDINPLTVELTGDEAVFVRNASTVRCEISAEAKKGAAIVEKRIAGQVVEGDALEIPNFSGNSLTAGVTDSRGIGRLSGVGLVLIPYYPLTANVTAGRTDPTSGRARVSVKGKYYAGGFGAQNNSLRITCQVGADPELEIIPEIADGGYTAEIELEGLDYQSRHIVTVAVVDKLTSLSIPNIIGKGIPVFDWGEDDFVFHVPVAVPDPQEDNHAVNKAWAVAKAGDTMTGPLVAPLLKVQSDAFPGLQICRGDGSLMATIVASDHHGGVYVSNNDAGACEMFFLPGITKGRAQDAAFNILTTKETVTIAQGGTGAVDPSGARANMGIGCVSLLAQSIDTTGAEQSLAAGYKAYLVIGCPRSGNSLVTSWIPLVALTETAVRYQLADNTDYCAFEMWQTNGVPAIRKYGGNGSITAVYGVN